MEKQIKTMNIFQLLAARLSKGKKVAPFILAGFLVFAFPIVSAALETITVTQGANGTITPGGTVMLRSPMVQARPLRFSQTQTFSIPYGMWLWTDRTPAFLLRGPILALKETTLVYAASSTWATA